MGLTRYTLNEFDAQHKVDNDVINSIELNIIAHFGNITCVELWGEKYTVRPFINNISNVGYILRELVELLDIAQEDGLKLSSIHQVPYRAGLDKDGKVTYIGHFTKDRFINVRELFMVEPRNEETI